MSQIVPKFEKPIVTIGKTIIQIEPTAPEIPARLNPPPLNPARRPKNKERYPHSIESTPITGLSAIAQPTKKNKNVEFII